MIGNPPYVSCLPVSPVPGKVGCNSGSIPLKFRSLPQTPWCFSTHSPPPKTMSLTGHYVTLSLKQCHELVCPAHLPVCCCAMLVYEQSTPCILTPRRQCFPTVALSGQLCLSPWVQCLGPTGSFMALLPGRAGRATVLFLHITLWQLILYELPCHALADVPCPNCPFCSQHSWSLLVSRGFSSWGQKHLWPLSCNLQPSGSSLCSSEDSPVWKILPCTH